MSRFSRRGHLGLPGPTRRVARHPIGLVATLVAAVLAVGVSSIGATARVQVVGEVASSFRGAYDILVRPQSARAPFEESSRLVQPNFLSGSEGAGLTFADLDRIKALPDVGVAAPASVLGWIALPPTTPNIVGALPDQPAMYDTTVSVTVNDGLGERTFYTAEQQFMLRNPTPENPVFQWQSDGLAIPAGEPVGPGMIDLPQLPQFRFPVLAVDPQAEASLLGDAGSSLLALSQWDRPEGGFRVDNVPRDWRFIDGVLDDSNAFASAMSLGPPASSRPVIPVVSSTSLIADAMATVTVRTARVPDALVPDTLVAPSSESSSAFAAALDQSGPWSAPDSETGDFGGRLRPLGASDMTFRVPGTTSDPVYGLSARMPSDRIDVGRLDLTPVLGATADEPEFALAPAASVQFGQEREQEYRVTRSVSLGPTTADDSDRPVFFFGVGSFDPQSCAAASAATGNPVPLGAYDVPETTLDDGTEMLPTFQPGGLISTPPLAIADIRDAATIRGDAPIDAIRVRLTGSLSYDAAGLARVERVASDISELGFAVDVVAGSSPIPVTLHVPGYVMPDGSTQDLVVHQQWTTLGAAQRVDVALSGATWALLGLGLATALAGVVSAELLHVLTRRREIAALRAVGWSRRRVVGWFVGEGVAQAVFVAAVGMAGWWFGGRTTVGLLAGLGVAALALLVDVLAVTRMAGTIGESEARSAGDVRDGALVRRPRVIGPFAYGLRTATARPWRTVAIAACVAVLAVALGVMVGVIASIATRTGPSGLALATLGVLRPFQMALLSVTAVVGAAISIVLLRYDARDRLLEWRVLDAVGWTRRRISRTLLAQRLCIAALAAAAAFGGAAYVGPRVIDSASTLVGVLAAAIAASSVAWSAPFHHPVRDRVNTQAPGKAGAP